MSNLTQRLITGTIFVIVLVGCIWWNPWSFLALTVTITGLGLLEFYRLAEKANAQPLRYYGALIGVIMVFCMFAVKSDLAPMLNYAYIPLVFLIFFIELWRKKSNPFANIAWTIGGLIYIAFPMMLLTNYGTPDRYLNPPVVDPDFPEWGQPEYHFENVLLIFILIWVSDSMAYVCGRLFGKHKLWERISPKKTWEGFIGGLVFCAVTGHFLGLLWLSDHDHGTAIMWTIIAVVISVTGMLGDLVESLFKRSIDVKDSGTILPGHGGILDRFDALFLAVPFALTVYWLYPV